MFLENFKMALNSLVAHKMRSFLTMLGIIIGISSVIAIVSLGEGGKQSILGQFEKIGASTFSITVNDRIAEKRDYLTEDDVAKIKSNISGVKYASPVLETQGVVSSDISSKMAIIASGNEEIAHISNVELIQGRFFTERDVISNNNVVVIDEFTAKYLFNTTDVIGKYVTIGSSNSGKKAMVIGVSKSVLDILDMTAPEEVESQIPAIIYTPYTFASTVYNSPNINTVYIVAEDKDSMDRVSLNAINYLKAKHRNRDKEDIYSSQSMMSQVDQINQVMDIFTTFIATVAGISLLVGGIGIMNILLVSVTERTREIGIRKAIGAKTKTILGQFLTEAIILSLLGGLIGLTLGVIVSHILGAIAGITPLISMGLVVGVITFSSAVGLFFGIYPAKKAAKLDPIDALRYE